MQDQKQIEIRLLSDTDSLEDLTALIHRAYGQLADLGFRYWGTHQSVEDTRQRISNGECYVALSNSQLVGTVVVNLPENTSPNPWYDNHDVTTFHQFAVDPKFQKQGIGMQLLDVIERRAAELGARELACDTAEGATHLIALYKQRGFVEVGKADWGETNYESVVLSKNLLD